MKPKIETLTEIKLVGKWIKMNLANDKTRELWQSFMPRRKEINNTLKSDLFCMTVFDNIFNYKDFNQDIEFIKWAAVEVSDYNKIPDGMDTYTIKGGLYAVFHHLGSASDFHKTFKFIFDFWLPKSEFELDKREHFEILGDKYKNYDPNSEEEVWIPIKRKN